MNINKKSLFFLLFLLLLPIAYSTSLQELIASYDFSYTDNTVNITGINNYGTPTILYDKLIINFTTETYTEGNYTFVGELNNIVSVKTIYLTNTKDIQIEFNPQLMETGNYNLSLEIYRDEALVYEKEEIHIFYFDNTDYEKPEIVIQSISHQFVDADYDSKYETLALNLEITSATAKEYEITAYLMGNDAIIESQNIILSAGTNMVAFEIDTSKIKNDKADSLLLYGIDVDEYSFEYHYQISDYSLNDLVSYESYIIGITSESTADTNNNNQSDYLQLDVNLEITEDADYSIKTVMYDLYDGYIAEEENRYYLTQGENTFPFRINGTSIFRKKFNGPYLIYLNLEKEDVMDQIIYTTAEYYFDQFEIPPLADLEIRINSSNGDIITTNIGEIPAFNIFIEIYGNNSLIRTESIPVLLKDESFTANINLEDYSSVSAISDFDNFVEESNEANNFYYFNMESGIEIFNISLAEGWNLISIPLQPVNDSVDEVLKDIEYEKIFTYETTWFTPDYLDPNSGYWLYSNISQILTIEGSRILRSFELNYSKFLIGYPYLEEVDIENYNFQKNISIFSYNSSSNKWETFNTKRNDNKLDSLKAGNGYFVK